MINILFCGNDKVFDRMIDAERLNERLDERLKYERISSDLSRRC